ncbi:MAG: nucleotidyltransferase family protein [Gammaproteobacteria bacterium]|nr:nucleotidyltransferase family protein [Gammaproteobacteria bacterium]
MKAMILAAGRGKRMRPLTDRTPKALLEVGGKALIEHHLARLRAAGVAEVVINIAHLAEAIRSRLGDGARYGLHIRYSDETGGVLETGGGIVRALPHLADGDDDVFLVINADVFTDYAVRRPELGDDHAHLVLVNNPPHRPHGDFLLNGQRLCREHGTPLTFSGIGYYRRTLFSELPDGHNANPAPLAPLLEQGIAQNRISGEHYRGLWADIGTPQRLEEIRRHQ